MFTTSFSVLVILLKCLTFGKADLNLFDMFENLNTLKLLEGLQDYTNQSKCLDDINNFTQALRSGKIWALTSEYIFRLLKPQWGRKTNK